MILGGSVKRRVLCAVLASMVITSGCARVPHPGAGPSSLAAPAGQGFYHTVARGETLYRIARQYDIPVTELMRVNTVRHPSRLETGQRLFIPRAPAAPAYRPAVSADIENVRSIVGPKNLLSDWRTITVHHSGTRQGNARLFDRDHRRRKMGGLFYHFVIGNGTNTPDGFIEVGWRWKHQVKANRPYDIQICLVGNFDVQDVSETQMKTLENLIGVLRQQYGVPVRAIRQHRDVPGKVTDCPGKRFPFSRLINDLSRG